MESSFARFNGRQGLADEVECDSVVSEGIIKSDSALVSSSFVEFLYLKQKDQMNHLPLARVLV